MIDWIKMHIPLPHPAPISSGFVQSVDDDGVIEWHTAKRRPLKGSHDAQVNVRTVTHTADRCVLVEFDGNPVKWLQGHNLWGTDDVVGLVLETCELVAQRLGVDVSAETRAKWRAGHIELFRVDVACSFALDSRAQVLAWIRAAEQSSHLAHRGRGQLTKGSTLYYGKNSRRWSLKLYSKGQEIHAKGHGQDAVLGLPSAVQWADRVLRAELVLRKLELKRLLLDVLANWKQSDEVTTVLPFGLLMERLGRLTMTTTSTLSPDVLESLRPSLRAAFLAWESGHDLREMFPRPTFYRYRAALLPHGIDIATVVPKATTASNVVPLHRVLEPRPVDVPAWAVGTPLYFEPRKFA